MGTHALIQEKVVYDRLALVITDEQHRFGVGQRELLSEQGKYAPCTCYERNPHSKNSGNYPLWGSGYFRDRRTACGTAGN